MKHSEKILVFIAASGFLVVALGAFGAHGLKEFLAEHGHTETWKTAVRYQMWHTLAMLAVSARPVWAGSWLFGAWIVGIILFSGSLYALALGAPGILGAITPLGGLALLFGWGILLAIAFKHAKS